TQSRLEFSLFKGMIRLERDLVERSVEPKLGGLLQQLDLYRVDRFAIRFFQNIAHALVRASQAFRFRQSGKSAYGNQTPGNFIEKLGLSGDNGLDLLGGVVLF